MSVPCIQINDFMEKKNNDKIGYKESYAIIMSHFAGNKELCKDCVDGGKLNLLKGRNKRSKFHTKNFKPRSLFLFL